MLWSQPWIQEAILLFLGKNSGRVKNQERRHRPISLRPWDKRQAPVLGSSLLTITEL